MKRTWMALTGLILLVGAVSAQDDKAAPKGDDELKDLRSKTSYAIGCDVGGRLKSQGMSDLDAELIARGLRDALADKARLTDDQIAEVLQAYQRDQMQKAMAKIKADAKTKAANSPDPTTRRNRKAGEEFLAANAKKPGVKVTDSGLQYKVLQEGTGPSPKKGDVASVRYRGTLIDGREFQSTPANGKPTSLRLDQVIKGWNEALTMMKVGSKWQLFIPADLAYGDNGSGELIEPGATLIFDLELVGIQ